MCFSHNKQQEQRGPNVEGANPVQFRPRSVWPGRWWGKGGEECLPVEIQWIPANFVAIGCKKMLLTFWKIKHCKRGERVAQKKQPTQATTTQNFALFFSRPPLFSFFLPLLGVLSCDFGGVIENRGPPMCTFGLSGNRVKPRRLWGSERGPRSGAGQMWSEKQKKHGKTD